MATKNKAARPQQKNTPETIYEALNWLDTLKSRITTQRTSVVSLSSQIEKAKRHGGKKMPGTGFDLEASTVDAENVAFPSQEEEATIKVTTTGGNSCIDIQQLKSGVVKAHSEETLTATEGVLSEDVIRLQVEYEQAKEILRGLEHDLVKYVPTVTAEQVLQYQQDVIEAESKVTAIEEAIKLQELLIERELAGLPGTPDLDKKLEDMLAEIACGNATEADLKPIEDEIEARTREAASAHAKSNPVVELARKTIAGLSRKRDEAAVGVTGIKAHGPKVRELFLKSQAEVVGREYAASAACLNEAFNKLMAIDVILGNQHRLRENYNDRLFVPAFTVAACRGLQEQSLGDQYNLVGDKAFNEDFEAAVNVELANFSSLGIQL